MVNSTGATMKKKFCHRAAKHPDYCSAGHNYGLCKIPKLLPCYSITSHLVPQYPHVYVLVHIALVHRKYERSHLKSGVITLYNPGCNRRERYQTCNCRKCRCFPTLTTITNNIQHKSVHELNDCVK